MAKEELAMRAPNKDEAPPNGKGMFIEASVLTNIKADDFVAVFGLRTEGATPNECMTKMSALVASFKMELQQVGVSTKDVVEDFIGQNRIYGFRIEGDIAKETLEGFELKKNVSIHYKRNEFIDRLLVTAAKLEIYDLIKVDYVVLDMPKIQTLLFEQASKTIQLKRANYLQHLGVKLGNSCQVISEKYGHYYPTESYESYTAYEGENISEPYYRQKYAVQSARKARTFYFQPLDGKLFDNVLQPVVTEPIVQCTVFLRVWYPYQTEPQRNPKSPIRRPK